MSNDVLLVPINIEQPNVEAQSDVVVYVPQAHKNKAGIVKEGEGINIENGVVSLDTQTVEDMIDANKWVSYGFQQNLTEDEKGMARHNIGAGDNDFTGSYYDVTQKPHLNTDNSVSLPIGDEEINNTVQLHKISKTGSFNDLNAVPHETLDFAESERQKSKNLYTNKVRNENVYGMVWKNENGRITVIGTPYEAYTENFEKQPLNIENAGEYTLSVYSSDQSFAFGLWVYDKNDNLLATFSDRQGLTHELDEDAVSCRPFIEDLISGNSYAFNFNLQLEYGLVATDYQPYHGLITHNGDAPVVFAEAERQKSKNLFNINKLTLSQGGTVSNNQINLTQYYALSSNNFTDLVNLKPNTNYVFSCKSTATEPASTQIAISSSLETVYWYENTSKSFTQEEINAMTTFYIYGNRDNSASVISEIQIEEGTEATEYQPYNGSIVHEKDISDVEHIEVLYDMSSSDESINLGYTGGIQPEATVSNLALSKYKSLKIWFANYGFLQYQSFLTLSIVGNGSRECQTTSWNSNYQVAVNKLDNVSSITNLSGDDNRIWKIEGVY